MPKDDDAATQSTYGRLDGQAGRREQVVDEHMYRLPPGARYRATFRLQLFTAPQQRPVAVATQLMGEGTSLINAAEACASSVWQQYFPDDAEPPIWIQRFLPESGSPSIAAVSFTVDAEARRLSHPAWRSVRDEDVDALVGQHVDRERGAGFIPPEPELEERPERYAPAWVALFPKPAPFRQSACMSAGTPLWRRLARQFVPYRGARGCCWYHGGDWHTVSSVAMRLVRQAQSAGVPHDEIPHHVDQQTATFPLSDWEREALLSLLIDTVRPYRPFQGGYNNGQHRAQAMLDAGVRRTLVERY
ncbi:hypothetical protein [Micromonospora inaquosa]|uniref:hypothetical protein n=1 Tax=Micromonospora inaquosa TaxID=2203716 RepID=UPI000F5E44C9|nr:hypothetical protein [Micromonospora inaquosa]